MSQNKNIPGIYNWCDKWCERCPLTSKCLLYQNENSADDGGKDFENEAFWNNLNTCFEETVSLLNQNAERFDIDLDAISEEEIQESAKDHEIMQLIVETHPLSKVSNDYPFLVKKWFEDHPIINNDEKNIEKLVISSGEEARKYSISLNDSLEIIKWYQFMVPIKCKRALMDVQMDNRFDEELPEEEKCHNGSAKVAALAINRSLQAWTRLIELMPKYEDSLFKIMSVLQKTSVSLNTTFPHAQKFIRPGFDEKPF